MNAAIQTLKGILTNVPTCFNQRYIFSNKEPIKNMFLAGLMVYLPPSTLYLINMTVFSSQAIGIDNDEPGFEKDGDEIKILKHNGTLALFLLANGHDVEEMESLKEG